MSKLAQRCLESAVALSSFTGMALPARAFQDDLRIPEKTSPSLLVASRESPASSKTVTLRNGFVIEQNEKTARYEFDQKGRISKISFPDGYTVSGISYHDKSDVRDVITGVTITSSGVSKTYQRDSIGIAISSSWKVTAGTGRNGPKPQDFSGDFEISPFGEFVVADYSPTNTGSSLPTVKTPEGQSFRVQKLLTGAQLYLDEGEKLLALRRTDFSLIRLTYLKDQISEVTEIERGGYKRVWSYDQNKKTWACSDPNIAESSASPFFNRGSLVYARLDGAKVNVSTTGAKTVTLATGLRTVESSSGQVRFINAGTTNRELIYDKQGRLIAYRDSGTGKYSTHELLNSDRVNYRADRSGAIYADSDRSDGLKDPIVSPPQNLRGAIQRVFELPQLLVHPHYYAPQSGPSFCRKGVCPDSLQAIHERGVLVNPQVPAVGQNSLTAQEVDTWTSLDSIANSRGGQLAPLVEFLRIWAETTSDEDIESVSSPEVLSQLKSQDGIPWIRPELISSESAEYLIWLRERIRENKLPCDVDVAPLVFSDPTKPQLFGGRTRASISPLDGSLGIKVTINMSILDRASLKADLERIGVHGGLGVYSPKYFQQKSAFDTFVHELHHVWAYSAGREYESFEPAAHLGALQVFSTITPEKGPLYLKVIDKYLR